MTIRRSAFVAISLAAMSTAAAIAPAGAQMAAQPPMMAADPGMQEPRLVRVTIENLTTGQNFSPAFVASHGDDMPPLFELGATASEPLWNVAEGGNIGPYSSAAASALSDGTIGDAVIGVHTPPGGTRTFYITVTEADPLLSGVFMLGMTNDGFSGFVGIDAYELDGPVTLDLMGYDAGSERNNEANGFLGALGQGNMRDEENGVIAVHTGIRGDSDAPIAWNFDPSLVARVTITPASGM